MRDILLDALRKHAEGHVAKHKANVEVYLHSTTGIGEHPEIVQALETEIDKLADAQDKLKTVKELLHPTSKHLAE